MCDEQEASVWGIEASQPLMQSQGRLPGRDNILAEPEG
jgi:hypothetical protein